MRVHRLQRARADRPDLARPRAPGGDRPGDVLRQESGGAPAADRRRLRGDLDLRQRRRRPRRSCADPAGAAAVVCGRPSRGKGRLPMPRTRRVDCSGPGLRRVRRGKGFSYHEEDGERITDAEVIERIAALGDPARLERRLDLLRPARAHPGDRASTPPAASSTATTTTGGRSGTGRSSTRCSSSPGACRSCASGSTRASPSAGSSFDRVCAAGRRAARPAGCSGSAASATRTRTRATG